MHRTTGPLQVFHVTDGKLYYRNGIDGSPILLVSSAQYVSASYGWVDIIGRTEDQGLLVAYTDGLDINIISYNGSVWSAPTTIYTATDTIRQIKMQRTVDYRIAIQVYTNSGVKLVITNRASIMGATQDMDKLNIEGTQSLSYLSLKQPQVVTATIIDNYTLLVSMDAPYVLLGDMNSNIYLDTEGNLIPCATGVTVTSETSFTITTNYNLAFSGEAILRIMSNAMFQTPGGTQIIDIVTPCNPGDTAVYSPEIITVEEITNIIGGV